MQAEYKAVDPDAAAAASEHPDVVPEPAPASASVVRLPTWRQCRPAAERLDGPLAARQTNAAHPTPVLPVDADKGPDAQEAVRADGKALIPSWAALADVVEVRSALPAVPSSAVAAEEAHQARRAEQPEQPALEHVDHSISARGEVHRQESAEPAEESDVQELPSRVSQMAQLPRQRATHQGLSARHVSAAVAKLEALPLVDLPAESMTDRLAAGESASP